MGTPIINQPQVAIMGVGAIEKRPKVITGAGRRGHDRDPDLLVFLDLVRSPAHRRGDRGPVPGSCKKQLETYPEAAL